MRASDAITVSVVVPVYQGERTLDALVSELLPLTSDGLTTPNGARFRVVELILVHDGAPDGSADVMERLAGAHDVVRTLWLSRNFGQHPALLAGMESSTGEWVATLDEDGQHDPADLPRMLDAALAARARLVYAKPVNPPPHGWARNVCSRWTKGLISWLSGRRLPWFHSFRLVEGEVARSLPRTCQGHVYLDVALSWVVDGPALCPATMRLERGRPSGYSFGKLLGHFWKLVLASGTKPLRAVAFMGGAAMSVSALVAAVLAWRGVSSGRAPDGVPLLLLALCFLSGGILLSLAVLAEYLAVTLTRATGRPLYLTVPAPPKPGDSAAPAQRGSVAGRAVS